MMHSLYINDVVKAAFKESVVDQNDQLSSRSVCIRHNVGRENSILSLSHVWKDQDPTIGRKSSSVSIKMYTTDCGSCYDVQRTVSTVINTYHTM